VSETTTKPPASANHASELQEHQFTSPNTGNATTEKKYQQQDKLAAKQSQDHQKLQQQQEKEHQQATSKNYNDSQKQQIEKKHTQHTEQLEKKNTPPSKSKWSGSKRLPRPHPKRVALQTKKNRDRFVRNLGAGRFTGSRSGLLN
jgi:hypothetical protein